MAKLYRVACERGVANVDTREEIVAALRQMGFRLFEPQPNKLRVKVAPSTNEDEAAADDEDAALLDKVQELVAPFDADADWYGPDQIEIWW